MPEYDNTNRFSLFRNKDRKTDSHPEFSGTLNVDGREFWLSAWVKEGKNGKFFSGSIKAKDQPPLERGKMTITSGPKARSDHDDEIPPF